MAARVRYLQGGEFFMPGRFHPLEVRPDGDDGLLVFNWSKNPNRFALRFVDVWRAPVTDAEADLTRDLEDWFAEFEDYWYEWLDTGLVYWGEQALHADIVELTMSADDFQPPLVRPVYYVSQVPLGPRGDGAHLARQGLDITVALDRRDEGRLLAWLQCMHNRADPLPVAGQAVVSWASQDPPAARIDLLTVVEGMSDEVGKRLIDAALIAAADAGAEQVVTRLRGRDFVDAGFQPRLTMTDLTRSTLLIE